MDYQLVIKFWRKSLEDEAFFVTLESELTDVLGDAVFDGYDTNAEEINVFVNTADPRQSFRRIKRLLEKRATLRGGVRCIPAHGRCAIHIDLAAASDAKVQAAVSTLGAGLDLRWTRMTRSERSESGLAVMQNSSVDEVTHSPQPFL